MANLQPFQPYRYTSAAGPLDRLVTQPYDKITPAMRARYLDLSPYNIVRIILGDHAQAAVYLRDWIATGILAQDPEPAFYAYFQSNDGLTRKGFIGLGAVEDYSKRIVHRHEQTLIGPKKDRADLLKHTRAHFGQIFMLYPDPNLAVDQLLDEAAQAQPDAEVTDEYGTIHRLWKIADPARIAQIQHLMADKKLLIADGHHRYETALASGDPFVMMTFVNMHAPGLKILATHRVLNGLPHPPGPFPNTRQLASLDELKQIFAIPDPSHIRIGISLPGKLLLFERERQPGELDVQVLHNELLGITPEEVREEKYLHYVRDLDAAYNMDSDVAFLLEPVTVNQVAEVAFSGGVMPQKSTDFFPKLLSGLTIYKIQS